MVLSFSYLVIFALIYILTTDIMAIFNTEQEKTL